MVAGIVLVAAYLVYALGAQAPAPEDLKGWAIAMLVFMGIAVAAVIVIQILFHIVYSIGYTIKERAHDDREIERNLASFAMEDEMDKLIDLRSARVGYACIGLGFAALLVALALGLSAVVALHIGFGACAAGGLLEGAVSIHLFERGLRNG
jgi:hypothetical protein